MRILVCLFLLTMTLPGSAWADVSTEARELVAAHRIKRAEGLIRLNTAFIARYQKLEVQHMQERNLEGAKACSAKVNSMQTENEQLEKQLKAWKEAGTNP